MQRNLSNKIQLGNTLNPKLDYGGFPAIDSEGTLENLFEKVVAFWKNGKADEDLVFEIFFQ